METQLYLWAWLTVMEELLPSVLALGKAMEGLVESGKANYSASSDISDYIRLDNKNGIRLLYRAKSLYVECMRKVGVKTRKELEQLWAKGYSNPALRDAVEALLEAEDAFSEFTSMLDRDLVEYEERNSTSQDAIKAGQRLPEDLCFVEASSGEAVPLESHWKTTRFTLFVLLRHFG